MTGNGSLSPHGREVACEWASLTPQQARVATILRDAAPQALTAHEVADAYGPTRSRDEPPATAKDMQRPLARLRELGVVKHLKAPQSYLWLAAPRGIPPLAPTQ